MSRLGEAAKQRLRELFVYGAPLIRQRFGYALPMFLMRAGKFAPQ
jgi:hypothetical protein